MGKKTRGELIHVLKEKSWISLCLCIFTIIGLIFDLQPTDCPKKEGIILFLSTTIPRLVPAHSWYSKNLCWKDEELDGLDILPSLCCISQHGYMNMFVWPNYSTPLPVLKRKVPVKLDNSVIGHMEYSSIGSKNFPVQMMRSSETALTTFSPPPLHLSGYSESLNSL